MGFLIFSSNRPPAIDWWRKLACRYEFVFPLSDDWLSAISYLQVLPGYFPRELHSWECHIINNMFLDGQVRLVRFFVNKRTKDKLPFARWANGKPIKKNRLSFRFPFEMAAYRYWCTDIEYIYMYIYLCLYLYVFIYVSTVHIYSICCRFNL